MIDRLLICLFRVTSQSEREFSKRRSDVANLDRILNDMDIIDAKSAALLTHVSIMLAVVVVLVTNASSLTWQIILTVELLAFSVVGLLLLRCVDIMGPPFRHPSDNAEDATDMYFEEIALRRTIYQWMVRAVFVLTLFLIGLVVVKTALLLR